MKRLSLLFSITFIGAICAGTASAQCTRHFYNNSYTSFVVNFHPGFPPVTPQGLCDGIPGGCVIKPGRTATLVYFPLPFYTISIVSNFYDKTFAVSGCYIHHSGNTGLIVVNDPADGDITTCGNPGWPCPSVKSRRSKSGVRKK